MKSVHRVLMGAAAVAGALALVAQTPALADDPGVKVGVLTCNEAGGWGLVLGSSHDLHCTFSPAAGEMERYEGTIDKVGVDIGYRGAGVIVWQVWSPTDKLKPGSLEGGYGGVQASASAGPGVGANVLVGGSGHAFSLQPVSVEGHTGLNLAAGVGQITLHYKP
jgi:hypothetical protein